MSNKRNFTARIRMGAAHDDLTLGLGKQGLTFDLSGMAIARKKRIIREVAADHTKGRSSFPSTAAVLASMHQEGT